MYRAFHLSLVTICSLLLLSGCNLFNSKKESVSGEFFFTVNEDIEYSTRSISDSINSLPLWFPRSYVGVIATYQTSSGAVGTNSGVIQPFVLINNPEPFRGKTAIFQGKLENIKDTKKRDYTYHVIYPYTDYKENVDLSAIEITLPSTQRPTSEWIDTTCVFLISEPVTMKSTLFGEDLFFNFNNLFSVLKVNFNELFSETDYYLDTIKRVTLSLEPRSEDRLAGSFYADLEKNECYWGDVGNQHIVLDYTELDNLFLFKDMSAWFVINPGEYVNMTLNVETDKRIVLFENLSVSVQRGEFQQVTVHPRFLGVEHDSKNVNIPDPAFKAYLIKHFDKDRDKEISREEALEIRRITCNSMGIKSIEGVEFFPNLEYLNCSSNLISNIDNINHVKLTYLDCSFNNILYFSSDKTPALTDLNCSYNSIDQLKLKGSQYLKELNCSNNNLTQLDLSNQTLLSTIDCSRNRIESVDLSNCRLLTQLICNDNLSKKIDLTDLSNLTKLICSGNSTEELILQGCNRLSYIECDNNSLQELSLEGLNILAHLSCKENALYSLGINTCFNLKYLDCSFNQLRTFDVSQCDILETLICSNNLFWELDLDKRSYLRYLDCSNKERDRKIEKLLLDGCVALSYLDCSNNKIDSLMTYDLYNLTSLDCSNNNLNYLDLRVTTRLKELVCYSNQLETLDLSNSTEITTIDCSYNKIDNFRLGANTSLSSITCHNNNILQLRLENMRSLTHIDCSNNKLNTLQILNLPNVYYIDCSFNQISTLNLISDNRNIEYLDCRNNPKLTTLHINYDQRINTLLSDSNTRVIEKERPEPKEPEDSKEDNRSEEVEKSKEAEKNKESEKSLETEKSKEIQEVKQENKEVK